MFEGSTSTARTIRTTMLVVMVVVFGLALAWTLLAPRGDRPSFPYSAMLAAAQAGQVTAITQDGTQLTVSLKGEAKSRTVVVASTAINVYAEACAAAGKKVGSDCPIRYEAVEESAAGQWLGLLITAFLPVLLIGAFIFFMMRAQLQKK